MNSLNIITQEYDKGALEFSRYVKMLFTDLKKREPEIRKLITILREKGAGALADVVEKLLSLSQNDQELLADLKHAVEEGELEEWGSIIHETLEREKHLAPETLILKVSIKVAYSTVRPNQT
jgi:predicted SnoaL-like aldol condensation-catalyzing enzyme